MSVLTAKIDFWSKWDSKTLRLKSEEVGSREFDRGWRQKALTDDETVFKESVVKACIDETECLYFPGDGNYNESLRKNEVIFMGIDLAIAGSKSKGDYFVMTVIGVNYKTNTKRIISIFKDRGLTFNNQLLVAEKWADYFLPKTIFVENNAYQDAFHQELKRTTYLPVEPFTTTAINKNDLEQGLPRLAIDFEKKSWIIPFKDPVSKSLCGDLIEELLVYPIGVRDDMLMSLWFSAKAAAWKTGMAEKRILVL